MIAHTDDTNKIQKQKISKLKENNKFESWNNTNKGKVNPAYTKTKDGIHIIFGISIHKAAQVLIREKVLTELKNIWDDLPLINDILDISGISDISYIIDISDR